SCAWRARCSFVAFLGGRYGVYCRLNTMGWLLIIPTLLSQLGDRFQSFRLLLGEAIRREPELARRKQFCKLLSRRSFSDQGEEAEDPREHLFVQKLVQVDLF